MSYNDYDDLDDMETFTLIASWEDPPEPGRSADEWPYPTSHNLSEIRGELAERIRRAFGAEDGEQVTIQENIVSGGYSEYTIENDYEYTVRCGEHVWSSNSYSGIWRLLAWLDESENKEAANV